MILVRIRQNPQTKHPRHKSSTPGEGRKQKDHGRCHGFCFRIIFWKGQNPKPFGWAGRWFGRAEAQARYTAGAHASRRHDCLVTKWIRRARIHSIDSQSKSPCIIFDDWNHAKNDATARTSTIFGAFHLGQKTKIDLRVWMAFA